MLIQKWKLLLVLGLSCSALPSQADLFVRFNNMTPNVCSLITSDLVHGWTKPLDVFQSIQPYESAEITLRNFFRGSELICEFSCNGKKLKFDSKQTPGFFASEKSQVLFIDDGLSLNLERSWWGRACELDDWTVTES